MSSGKTVIGSKANVATSSSSLPEERLAQIETDGVIDSWEESKWVRHLGHLQRKENFEDALSAPSSPVKMSGHEEHSGHHEEGAFPQEGKWQRMESLMEQLLQVSVVNAQNVQALFKDKGKEPAGSSGGGGDMGTFKPIKPMPFSGQRDSLVIDKWIRDTESFFRNSKMDERNWPSVVSHFLEGDAYNWFLVEERNDPYLSWRTLKTNLRSYFVPKNEDNRVLDDWRALAQGETKLQEYVGKYRQMMLRTDHLDWEKETQVLMAENLKLYHTWLLDSLLRFKRPNAKSRSALDVTRVVIGNHKMDVNSKLKTVALEVSKQLMLDEVQSYILVSNHHFQVFSHLSFRKLLSTYSSQGYGCGRELYLLVISDLYFHLHGELEAGRHVPAGLFEDLVDILDTLDVTAIVRSKEKNYKEEFPSDDASVYDTEMISQHLGLEWWSGNSPAVAQTAKSTLKAMGQANMMSSLGSSQISALEALISVFSFLFSDTELVGSRLNFDAKVAFVVEVSSSIELTMERLGPEGDPTQFMQRFLLAQLTLLRVFLQWILDSERQHVSNDHVGRLCSKVVSTLVKAVKPISSSLLSHNTMKQQLIKSLLGASLSCLELLIAQNGSQALKGYMLKLPSDYERAFVSDITTLSAEFLPYLCSFVESKCHSSLAIFAICILINHFLVPHIWLPVLQMQSTISHALSLLHATEDTEIWFQVLSLLLSLSHVRNGVELLQAANGFSHILMFTEKLKEELSHGEVHGPFSVSRRRGRRHELWGLSAAIVAAFVQALAENTRDRAIEVAFAFLDSQKEQILHALQSPGCLSTETGNMVKCGNTETTVSALQETNQALHVLVVLVRYPAQWAQVMGASEVVLRHKCIHLLAYIAKEGLMRNAISSGTPSFRCYPNTKEEVRSHRLPSRLNTTSGWFGLAAKGVSMTHRFAVFEPNDQASLSLLSRLSHVHSQADCACNNLFRFCGFICL
ncbi:hypothetical protein L7F22_016174 [Adiantum nelumboides]|nr:hypothetical protein [Adiantum nelumboides]